MTGTGYIIIGIVVLTISTVDFIGLEKLLQIKKKRIREGVYQLYD